METQKVKHHYHSLWKRAVPSLSLVVFVMLIGTLGIHFLEGYSLIDAFYFMSMIATAQGTAQIPQTAAGKIFVSLMAFVSVGSVVAALVFLLGPFAGRLVKVGFEKFEEEMIHRKGEEGKK